MQKTDKIWKNGKLVAWDEAHVHVLSHGLHYGSGAFEGIRFYQTHQGPAIFKLYEHVDRFFYSASCLNMNLRYSKAEISHAIQQVVLTSGLSSGYIRPLAFYGYGNLGVNPGNNPVEVIVACWPWGAYLAHEAVDVKVSNFIRIHPDSSKVDAKLAGHYVNGILASLELKDSHYHEALFLDSQGYLSEGVGENFFVVKNGEIYTPKLGTILNGITRDTVIQLAKELKYSVHECHLTLEDAYRADEAFFTGTAAEVTGIRSLNDHVYGNGTMGKITEEIKKAYLQVVSGQNTLHRNSLTWIKTPSH